MGARKVVVSSLYSDPRQQEMVTALQYGTVLNLRDSMSGSVAWRDGVHCVRSDQGCCEVTP